MSYLTLDDIAQLRAASRSNTILWSGEAGAVRTIRHVSDDAVDPDRTGVADYIAIFEEGGHVDLANAEKGEFLVAKPLYDDDLPTPHLTLEDALEAWQVHEPGTWENATGPKDWHAVSNNGGIVAYFGNETDAHRYRLSMINRDLNP